MPPSPRRRPGRTTALVVAAALVLLTACTTGRTGPSATPDPTAETPPPAPAETRSPAPEEGRSPERVGSWEVEIPVDSGPAEYANGTVVLDASGVPVEYVVGAGDIIDFVAKRLGIDDHYLLALNQVRRGWTGSLYLGDTLNLDPHTITSVGSVNGHVLDEPPPSPMPPQR